MAIGRLLYATNQNVDSAENGIVFIDEIDKIARRSGGARTGAGSRDIGGEGVQQSLLKILEGEKIFVPLNVTSHWNKYDYVEIDIANILFICAGSFSDIDENSDTKPIGFFGEGETRGEGGDHRGAGEVRLPPRAARPASGARRSSTGSLPTISSRS